MLLRAVRTARAACTHGRVVGLGGKGRALEGSDL